MTDLHRSLAAFRAALADIKRMYADEDDQEALRDTALGETTLEEDILRVLREAREREAMVRGLDELAIKLEWRKKRLNDGAERLRAACLQAMQEAGIKSIPAPDMTVSVGLSPPKVIITQETAIPSNFMRVKTTSEPDKAKIADALKRGQTIGGAELSNRQPCLRISTR